MTVVAFANQKGGVSKSTLACHLAIYLFDRAIPVGFLDTDEQQTSARWLKNAEPKLRVIVASEVDAIRKAKLELSKSCEIIVADSPGSGGDASHSITMLADLVIVPLQPSKPDLRAITDSLKYVRLAQEMSGGKRPKVYLVLTFTAKGDVKARMLRHELASMGLPVASSEIRRLNAFRDACDSAVTRQSTREALEASKDINKLFEEILVGCLERPPIENEQSEVSNG